MSRSLRKWISRLNMRAHVTMFGNNHSWLLNRRYRRYHHEAMRRYRPANPDAAAQHKPLVERFRQDGFLVIPPVLDRGESEALRSKVDALFSNPKSTLPVGTGLLRLVDGLENLPEVVDLLLGAVEEAVQGYFGSNFKIYNASFYRTIPDNSRPASSFLWHFDNSPDQEIKLMIYLDDVTEETGAFRFKDLATSEAARRRGFWHRDDYDTAIDIFEDPKSTVIAEGGPGTSILFRQGRVVHKATAPQRDHRDVVTMILIPSLIPWREHFARNRHLLSTNAGLCLNPWTDEPENIGYRY